MKKVLVVGEKGTSTAQVEKKLFEYFDVITSKPDINFISSTIMISKPELIVFNLLTLKAAEMILFQIKNQFQEIPIVLLCALTDSQKYMTYVDNVKVRAYYNEQADNSFIKLCCKSLNIDYNEMVIAEAADTATKKRTVLLIDDSSIFLRQGKSMLEEDYEVLLATSAEKGIELLKKNHVDLILLDYEMPITDGKDAFIEIREIPEKKNVPVIFLTGVSDKEHIAEVVKLKPNGYILKPVTKDTLLARIKPFFK